MSYFSLRFVIGMMLLSFLTNESPVCFGQHLARQYEPVVGDVHPDFVLPAIDDQRRVALSDFRGKKVVLIHFASW